MNLKLNKEKMKIKLPEVRYMGHLLAPLNRTKEVNLKLNKEKMNFKLPEVRYMGHLLAPLNRTKEVNLKLNKEKMNFKLPEVRYMGHLLTGNGVRADPAKIRGNTGYAKTRGWLRSTVTTWL